MASMKVFFGIRYNFFSLLPVALIVFSVSARASSYEFEMEAGAVRQGRNDVRIPADTGTRFSLSKLQTRTDLAYRVYLSHLWGEGNRHRLRALWAPLSIEAQGTAPEDIQFQGKSYLKGSSVTGFYKFNSYRLSYIYQFYSGSDWEIRGGFTGKIRDAQIKLTSGATTSERSNVGFVPLLHFSGAYRFGGPLSLAWDLDALAAPQGRAEDLLLALEYQSSPSSTAFRVGYRVLEGGAEGGGNVYNFALLHYVVLGVRF